VRRAALIMLAACACTRSSSKDDHAAPAATNPSEPLATVAHATAPGPTAALPSASSVAAPAAGKPSTVIQIDSVAAARGALGKRVRVDGTGDNAKLGAVVVKGDLVVYCIDRKDGWDERNIPVVVEGVLDYTSRAKARTSRDGSITAGTGEPIFQMTCNLVR
jgi:hypothetical protein